LFAAKNRIFEIIIMKVVPAAQDETVQGYSNDINSFRIDRDKK